MVGWIKAPKPMLEQRNPSTSSHDPSIARLTDAGAHLVLCKSDKRPYWSGWQRRRPAVDVAAFHRAEGGLLGVIASSLGSSVLDIDFGNPAALLAEFEPWADLPTPRGRHAYYDDDIPRRNGDWAARGCSGQVRSAHGYVILHDNAPELLVAALDTRADRPCRFPADLFEAAGLSPVAVEVPPHVVRPAGIEEAPRIVLAMERIFPGGRGIALFDQVRYWAYDQARGPDLSDWHWRVLCYAGTQNARFPSTISDGRVRDCAKSVADWVWSGGGPFDHGYVAQSRRGVASAKVRRYLIYDRDRAMVARLDAGESTRAVARAFGVDHKTVSTARARLTRSRRAPLVKREINQEVNQGTLAKLVQGFFCGRGLVP